MNNLKYKVGDRVKIQSLERYNKYKNIYGNINYGCETEILFTSEMSSFCGQVATITKVRYIGCVRFYHLAEDKEAHLWVDGMFEGFAEESLDNDMKEHQRMCDEIMDIQGIEPIEAEMEEVWHCPEGYRFVDENGNVINAQKIVLEKLVVPKFKKGDKIKDKNNRVWYVVQVGNRHFDISRIPSETGSGYFVPIEDQDYYELSPDRELPKTFEECVNVLMLEGGNRMSLEQMNTFRKLIDARNAYWTIYGEENGLGKPWEPDYNNEKQPKYGLYDILKYSLINPSQFVFPTEEMRDTFYENFKKEIEQCKEL